MTKQSLDICVAILLDSIFGRSQLINGKKLECRIYTTSADYLGDDPSIYGPERRAFVITRLANKKLGKIENNPLDADNCISFQCRYYHHYRGDVVKRSYRSVQVWKQPLKISVLS